MGSERATGLEPATSSLGKSLGRPSKIPIFPGDFCILYLSGTHCNHLQ